MWQQILLSLLKPVIQQFLENLAKQLGMPAGASPLQDQGAVDRAIEETANQLSSGGQASQSAAPPAAPAPAPAVSPGKAAKP